MENEYSYVQFWECTPTQLLGGKIGKSYQNKNVHTFDHITLFLEIYQKNLLTPIHKDK